MTSYSLNRLNVVIAFTLLFMACWSQNYSFKIIHGSEYCTKALAQLTISGLDNKDSLEVINWSTGELNVLSISNLNAGEHSVNIRIKRKDTLIFYRDTTLYYNVEKTECKVTIDKYFSPNDDAYHDLMNAGNITYYPNFELQIFNKWGQRVHQQKDEFEPWNGKWNGIDLPDGTYYYVFFYDRNNKTKIEKGDVTILR
jgi:gliding motility-associated-like protein